MFFTDSGRKLPWFLALFFHHTPYLCQLINETKTESPAESESYLMFSGNYPSPLELPFKKYNYFCWCKEFSDPLYIYNHETCLLSEFLNRNSMYLFPSKAYIKVCNQLTMPICRSTTFCSIHSIQQKDLMLWSSTLEIIIISSVQILINISMSFSWAQGILIIPLAISVGNSLLLGQAQDTFEVGYSWPGIFLLEANGRMDRFLTQLLFCNRISGNGYRTLTAKNKRWNCLHFVLNLILLTNSLNFIRLLRVVITPSENYSKQSDEFQANSQRQQ